MGGHYIVKFNNTCNSNCLFCPDKKLQHDSETDYSQHVYKLGVNRKRFASLIITGGEPTLHPRILEFVQKAKRLNYQHIMLATNGLLLFYASVVQRLVNAGVDSFQISFQTNIPEVYEKITGVRNSHKYVTGGIENALRLGAEVHINICMHAINQFELPQTVEYLITRGVHRIQLSLLNPLVVGSRTGKGHMALRFSELQTTIEKCFSVGRRLGFDRLFLDSLPVCAAYAYRHKMTDHQKPYENKDYYNSSKTKLKKCKLCLYHDSCDGIWATHLALFGRGEIRPIRMISDKNIIKH